MAHLELDDDQRYRALKSRDSRFDGVFIVGVRTTGIYCRPSCPTPVQPLRRNIDFFPTTAAAQRAGLRACKRCRPDATPGSPEWNLRDDLVGRAMRMINQGFLDSHRVADLARELGVAERHLRRLMIESVGAPPLALARAQRAQTARVLIETTGMKFTDVAFASGFLSLRQFNDTVREVFASSPTELRKAVRGGRAEAGQLALRLPFRSPVAADYLMSWWARRTVGGVAVVKDQTLRTALRLPTGAGTASLEFQEGWVACHMQLDDVVDLGPAVAQCRALLDLDSDPVHIDEVLASQAVLAPYVAALPGLRSPGSADGFATLVFAVLGQQRSVAAARTLADRIVLRVRGESEQLRPFPTGEELRDADLGGLGLTERNIATIHTVAAVFDGRERSLSPGADRGEVRRELLSIKGVGPWTADYVAMRALGHPDIFLGGDLVAARASQALGMTTKTIEATSPWRSYLTHHLWAASASLQKPKKPQKKETP
jgi:AraC family transcriptional regulator of adaptative response / DNA-3-methyladenine glycosylase II